MASRDYSFTNRRPPGPSYQDTSRSAHLARIQLESREELRSLEQLRDLGILNQDSDNRGPLNESFCSQDSLNHDTSNGDSCKDGRSRHDPPSSFKPYEQGSHGADHLEDSYIIDESSGIIPSIENPISELTQMPYNNAAIPPPEEITGQASLPR